MIWKYKEFDTIDEVTDFLDLLGNGCDYEAKIVFHPHHNMWVVFYPEKKS